MQGYKRSPFTRLCTKHAHQISWLWYEMFPRLLSLVVISIMILATLISIGDLPSDPVAADSLSPRSFSGSTLQPSFSTPDQHGDPGPGTTHANRVGQDLCLVLEL